MKKNLLFLAALALITAGTAFAQTAPAVKTTGTDANQTAQHYQKGPKNSAQQADRHAGKMVKELGLNADQEARVEKLMLAREQETTTLKAKYGADRQAGRAEMKAAHDRYEAQLKTILTPEQFVKLDKLKAEHHGHGNGKMKPKS